MFNDFAFEIIDNRGNVIPGELLIPIISLPGEIQKSSLAIDDEIKARFKKIIYEIKSDSNATLEFKLETLEGFMMFNAGLIAEKETVSWKLNLTAYDDSDTII